MIRFTQIFVALLLAVPAAAASQAPGRSGEGLFPYPIHEMSLDNGLRVVVVPVQSGGLFAMHEVVSVGSRDEQKAGHSGFAHFFEHMMFRGTPLFPADVRGDLLANLGVNEGGSTSDDVTVYRLAGPTSALAKVLELEGDRYQNLAFDEDTFRTEQKAVLGEYNKAIANPDLKAWYALRDAAFDVHPYKHTTLGYLEDIQKMPERLAYGRKFFERFYTPNNVLLIVVGDVVPEDVFAMVKSRFSTWKGKREVSKLPVEAPITKERRRRTTHETPTLRRVMLAWRVPSALADPRANTLAALLEGYLFSSSSPLANDLVKERGYLEEIGTWWWPHKDETLFPVYMRLRPGPSVDDNIDAVQGALDKIAAGEVDAARFAAVQSNLRYGALMRLASAEQIAEALTAAARLDLNVHNFEAELARTASMKPVDLSAFVKKVFRKEGRVIAVVEHDAPKGGAK